MDIILYFLACVGLTHIIVDSNIFAPIRNWFLDHKWEKTSELLSCYVCSGFWSGMFIGMIIWLLDYCPILNLLLWGFSGSLLSNFAAIYMNYLEAMTIIHIDSPKQPK